MRRPQLARESIGLGLLALAVGFNLVALAPEMQIGALPVNDGVMHLAATERLAQSLTDGEPFLDPWVSEWSLGYPLWRSYQPLPHLLAAAGLTLARPFADSAVAFAFLQYLLLALLPVSVYVGSRRFGLSPASAGLAAILGLLSSGDRELGRYGLGYGAFVWRGSGLFTQLVAMHFLALATGETARALDRGRSRVRAALLLAATGLSHLVLGYAAALLTVLMALVRPKGERSRPIARAAAVGLMAAVLVLWFLIPLVLSKGEVNHSRFEGSFKWDSFGAPFLLQALTSGELLDYGRGPYLTLLAAGGTLIALLRCREALPCRLLVMTTALLLLFFGRATWGHLLLLAGVPGDLHLHRLQAPFELLLTWLAAWGLVQAIGFARARHIVWSVALSAVLAAGIAAAALERVSYLADSARWGDENRAAFARERVDVDRALDEVERLLALTPGRVSAGLAAHWGNDFKVGSMPFYVFLTRRHIDEASFLYHSMSLTSDVMVLRDESDQATDTAFGVRAVVAPSDRAMPPHLRRVGVFGRFAIYEASQEGYVGLVDVAGRYVGRAATFADPKERWLTSPYPRQGVVYALQGGDPALPSFDRWQAFPTPTPTIATARGEVRATRKRGETLEAELTTLRPCYALVKITWHPDLAATVDGKSAPVLDVTPGFAAVQVPAGEHTLVVRYAPGPLKPTLFVLGLLAFALLTVSIRRGAAGRLESRLAARVAAIGAVLTRPPVVAAAAVAVLLVLGLRPLVQGELVDGHDATGYPPRLVELVETLNAGQVPPVWASHLSAGHGQPLFEFSPPVVYLAALVPSRLGLRLADSLQLGLVALFALGAWAVYRLGRRFGASRAGAVTVVAVWIFTPYLALDLFVRGAFAEATTLALAPLALLALVELVDSGRKLALAALGITALALSHNGGALLMIPAVVLVAATRATTLARPWPRLARVSAALLLGLATSAYFLLPAFVEKDYVKVDLLRQGADSWRLHELWLSQLFLGRWDFGMSLPGPNDGMSFALGWAHLGLAGLGLALAWRSRSRPRRATFSALALVAVLGAFLATNLSREVWALLPPLQYLAFPWRALMLPALALPLLSVPFVARLKPLACASVIGLVLLFNLSHTEPKGYVHFDDEYYAPTSLAAKGINTTTHEEYEPGWVRARPPHYARGLVSPESAVVVRELARDAAHERYVVSSPVAATVETATFYFPGWHATLDGAEAPLVPTAGRGTMALSIPPGEHTVSLALEATPVRRAGVAISLAAVVLLLLLWAAAHSRRRLIATTVGPSLRRPSQE